MNLIDRLVVSVVGDTAALKKSLANSKKQLSGFGAAVQKHSATFMKTGAVMMGFAGAIGIAAVKVGKEFDKAYSKIRTGTGKTGKVLEGLKKDFRAVVKDVPNSLDEVSTAIADLNTRLGLTGKPLQDMAKQMLNLARITDTDVNEVIRTSTRLFGDWDVAVEDQAETLDYLYRVSQETGVGVDTLADKVTTYGVQLRGVGYSMEDSIALLGKWEKEGVATEKMLGGLSMALGKFAKAQEDPEEAFNALVESINNATEAEGNALGVAALGTRAGADFAAAVREGRFELGDFKEALEANTDTINQAAEDTMTLTEKFDLLKNRAKLAIEPLAKKLMDELMPAIEKVTDKLGDLDEEQLDNIASSVLFAGKMILVGGAFIFAVGAVGKFTAAIKIATGWMATFHATALGPWGILAATIAGTTLLTGDSIRDLTELTEDQTKALNEAAGAVDELIPPHRNLAGAENDVREAMGELIGIAREHPQVCDEITNRMLPLIESYENGDITIEEFAEGMGNLKEKYEDLPDAIMGVDTIMEQGWIPTTEHATEVGEANAAVLAELKRQLDANEISQGEYDAAIKAATEATESQTGAFEDDRTAAEKLGDEIDDLVKSLFGLYNLNQSVTEATWDYEDSLENLDKVMEDVNSTEREKQEALFKTQDEMEKLLSAIGREYAAEGTSLERKEELRKKYIEVKDEAVDRGIDTEEAFKGIDEQFEIMTGDIYSNIYGYGGIIPSYRAMYDKGVELDEQKIEPTINADNKPAMDAIQKVIDKKIPDKHFTIYTHHREGFAGGGIAGFASGGITGSDGFSLPILTAAKGLITLPRADEGMLALLHPPELVLNPDQALRVLWKIANEPREAKSSPPMINNYFEIAELIVREEADIHKIAEDLYDLQETKQRGLGEK